MRRSAYRAPLPWRATRHRLPPPIQAKPTSQITCSRAFGARSPSIHRCPLPIETRRRRVKCAFSNAREVLTACSWNQLVLCSDEPALVEFWASWCGPCKMVCRLMNEIAIEYSGLIKCFKIDTSDYPQVADSYGVERIPTVLLFKNGEQLKSITGTLPKSVYVNAIEEMLAE